MSRRKKPDDYGTGIPLHEVEALARILLPEIQRFFESEEGQQEFAAWKAQKGVIPMWTIYGDISDSDLDADLRWDDLTWEDLLGDECKDCRFDSREFYKRTANDKKEDKGESTLC